MRRTRDEKNFVPDAPSHSLPKIWNSVQELGPSFFLFLSFELLPFAPPLRKDYQWGRNFGFSLYSCDFDEIVLPNGLFLADNSAYLHPLVFSNNQGLEQSHGVDSFLLFHTGQLEDFGSPLPRTLSLRSI